MCIAQVCSVFALMFGGEKFSKSHEAGCWNLILKFCLGFSLHYKFAQVLVVHIKI